MAQDDLSSPNNFSAHGVTSPQIKILSNEDVPQPAPMNTQEHNTDDVLANCYESQENREILGNRYVPVVMETTFERHFQASSGNKPEHSLGMGVELLKVQPLPKKPFKPTDAMKLHLADVKARSRLGDVTDAEEGDIVGLTMDGGAHFQAAATSMKGSSEMRDQNEDRFTLMQDVAPGIQMLAVFDGHGGFETSAFLKKSLAGEVAKQIMMVGCHEVPSLAGALAKSIKFCEDKFCKDSLPPEPDSDEEQEEVPEGGYTSSGSCLVVVLYVVEAQTLLVANVGDSRAVLGLARDVGKEEPNSPLAVGLTRDQTAGNPMELIRVTSAGATVDESGYILGELAPSRAIGDVQFKGGDPDISQDIIIAVPEISCYRQVPSGSLVLLASDGLWDAITSDEAVNFAQQSLHRTGSVKDACAMLAHEATKARGSEDDTTVLLLHLC